MAYTYIQAIGIGFPTVECHSSGDGSVYENIVWDGGASLPSKDALDQWIAANPVGPLGLTVTKYEFRKLYTLQERIAIDNAQANPSLSGQNKAVLLTLMKDLELSGIVELYNPDVASGVNFLEQVGLIASGRAAQILSNTPPTT